MSAMIWLRLSAALVVMSGIAGCANGPCRQLKHPELAVGSTAATPVSDSDKAAPREAADGRVFVARPDGSLQCGMKKGLDLNDMENDLKGIKVYSSSKKPDGKMHIQVCGSSTGTMNVYEIPTSSLSDAENRGFNKFGD